MMFPFRIGGDVVLRFPLNGAADPEPAPPSPIPSDYTELNYIQSSGAQWLDPQMDIPESTDTIQVQVKFAFTSIQRNYQDIVAMKQSLSDISTPYGLFFGSDADGNFFAKCDYCGEKYHTKKSHYEKVNDGTESATAFVATESGQTLPLMLFATWLGDYGVMEYAMAKMYYCRIYKNGTLVHDLLPCSRNADDKIGMYDIVAGAFRTNGGSGADFTGG